MGVVNKTKGLFRGAMSDEPVRTVDEKRSRLPDWEPDELPEPEPKQKSDSRARASRPAKVAKPTKTQETPVKPRRRSISDFETWDDDDSTGSPREIEVDQAEEPYPVSGDLGVINESGEDDSDDEMLDSLTSFENDEPKEAWDPSTVDLGQESDGVQDSSPMPYYAETPQTTVSDDDPSAHGPEDFDNLDDLDDLEILDDVSDDVNDVEPNEPGETINDNPPTQLEDEMTETEFEELPEVSSKTSKELIRDYSDEPLDLSRAISLEALDQIVFPRADDGYNRANVDAMLSFLRLSLNLYVRQAEHHERTVENLAEELETRNDQYEAARKQLRASVPRSALNDERAETDRLSGVVRDLASRLGMDSSELLGKAEEGADALVFQPFAAPAKADPPEEREKPSPEPHSDTDSTDDGEDEVLRWGSLR